MTGGAIVQVSSWLDLQTSRVVFEQLIVPDICRCRPKSLLLNRSSGPTATESADNDLLIYLDVTPTT